MVGAGLLAMQAARSAVLPSRASPLPQGIALTLLQLDPGGLQLGVLVKRVQRLVAAHAALLEATKRHGDVIVVERKDAISSATLIYTCVILYMEKRLNA